MENASEIKIRKTPLKTRILKYKWFYLLFVPVLAFVIVFYYTPMAGIRFAFTKYNLIKDPVFVGFKNFQRLFSLPNFWSAFYNTLKLSIVKLLLNTGMAVGISLLLHEMANLRVKNLAQTIIYLPHFLSWVVAASVFQMLFSPTTAGLLNQVLLKLGIIDKNIYFLGTSQWWTPTLLPHQHLEGHGLGNRHLHGGAQRHRPRRVRGRGHRRRGTLEEDGLHHPARAFGDDTDRAHPEPCQGHESV
jgi:ABC-type polysaccharide transport system permease subunit